MEFPIRAAVERYSVRPGVADGAGVPIDPADIVLVPPPDVTSQVVRPELPLRAGFALARRLLNQGRPVRLIAEGATLKAGWPSWTRDEPRLLLTELGAYRAPDLVSWSRPLRRAIEGWLETTFAGVLPPGLSAASVFYSVACARLFQALFDVAKYLDGLVERHPSACFHCADPAWVGLAALEPGVAALGGAVNRARPRPTNRLWAHELRAIVYGAVLRSTLGQLRAFHRSTRARRWLETQTARPSAAPDIWLAIVPCWGERANQHVLETVGLPALERGLRVGVLFTTSLDGGPNATPGQDAAALWPVLRHILPPTRDVVVDQTVSLGSFGELIATLSAAGRAASEVARRIAALDPVLRLAGFELDLRDHRSGLARLLGTDLIVALTTGRATQAALARRPGRTPVVFSALGFVESAAPNAWCQHAGVPTIDFVHGTGADTWHGSSETRATCRAVWTSGDAETVTSLGQRAVVTGVPRLSLPRPARLGSPDRVLVLSNYVHGSWAAGDYPLRFHQAELLRALRLVRARYGDRFQVRWRPHPNDNAAEIEEGLRQSPCLVRSTEPSLARDLAWSDIIVSSNSSSSIEALSWGRPVFLHVSPAQRFLPEVRAFAEERRFFYAAELPELFAACVAQLDARDPAALGPEGRARAALHGANSLGAGQVLDALIARGPC